MRISAIGTGYVGLVTGTCFAEVGNEVLCIDNDAKKLEKLQNKQIPIYEPGLETLFLRNIEKKRLEFSDDLARAVKETDVIFLCLPTPQGEDGSADLHYVMDVAHKIGKIIADNNILDYKVIVDKSTVPVGTGKKVKDIIAGYGVTKFDVVSNPEFLREGFAVEDFLKPDRVVVGADDEEAFKLMRKLYEPFVRQGNPIVEMDVESAEVTKYAANSYLAMRITYMNELANFCEKVGADVDRVRRGISTDTRIGKRFLFPGIGYGGSCFPKDVNALIKTSRDFGSEMSILVRVDEVNKNQKTALNKKLMKYFNDDLTGKTFAVWGLAFKPNTDDMREAPSVIVIKDLLSRGAKVKAYDPVAEESARFYLGDTIEYYHDQYEVLQDADALLILTEWSEFRNPDFKKVKSHLCNPLIFDGRNIYSLEEMEEKGFTYYSIGRKVIHS